MAKTSPLIVFTAGAAVFVGIGSYVHWVLFPEVRAHRTALESVAERLDTVESSIALLHFSGDPKGRPVQAILDHLRFWSEREEKYGSSLAERPILEEKLALALGALRTLGESAYTAVERDFFATANERELRPYRKRLLRVLRDLDPKRAKALADGLLVTPGSDPELRTVAGRILVDLDPTLAGQRLRHVILHETARGVRHVLPTGKDDTMPKGLKFRGYPGFFNLINLYLETADEAKTDVLLVVMKTEGHDIATLQACISGLEARSAKLAIEPMKKIYETPATHQQGNAYVRRRLAQAITAIAGPQACSWLKEQYVNERNRTLRDALGRILRANCGG